MSALTSVSKKRKNGRTPSIAKMNEATALANIKAKVKVLRAIAEGKDEPALKMVRDMGSLSDHEHRMNLPTTLRQFNKWTADAGSMTNFGVPEQLKGNSQDTVRRNPALRSSIESVLKLIVEVRKKLVNSDSVSESKLLRMLRVANNRAETLETELLSLEMRVGAATHARDVAQMNEEQIKKDFSEEIKKRDDQIADLLKQLEGQRKVVKFPEPRRGKKK